MTTAKPSSDSCLPWAASAVFGAAMGYAAWSLTVWARAYCDAGYDAGGRLELNALLPLALGAEALVALMAGAVGRRLVSGAPRTIRVALPTLLVIVTTVCLAWWLFAVRGTLNDYPGDSGLCPASNVPPGWPDWIPV
ncbi:hypothetical protein [Streptomyces sp. NPDC052721]|uniref:hypothetical protein n=1 Tax=Streptomyces sp. NPDC052721 TaxID=3154955 RepID=UPI003412A322